jgi:hypothetical protein
MPTLWSNKFERCLLASLSVSESIKELVARGSKFAFRSESRVSPRPAPS